MSNPTRVGLTLTADAHLARLVRMTAANVAMLSSMTVDRVEDIKMAAEEAFIYACGTEAGGALKIEFEASAEQVDMLFTLDAPVFAEPQQDDPAALAELLIEALCDAYEKREQPAALAMTLKADV